jgi:predicted pyridoxine 5'-phosphate oxidase superfamily flavin-nucleotide-binding protein
MKDDLKISTKQKKIIENNVIALATSDKKGNINVVAIACVKIIDDDKLLITDNFMNKTRKNILENEKVAVAFWSEDEEKG